MVLIVSVLLGLCGCGSWFSEEYVSITPHQGQSTQAALGQLRASSYPELYDALVALIRSGERKGMIVLSDLNEEVCKSYLEVAIKNVTTLDPVGAYAVEHIDFEVGSNAGRLAAAVQIDYIRSKSDILRIKTAVDMDEAGQMIGQALEQVQSSLVLRIQSYEQVDFTQLIHRFAEENPSVVMQTPQVMAAVYPHSGKDRLVELSFTYQTQREELLYMQKLVKPVFTAAELSVQGNSSQREKYIQLYSFLMERFDYEYAASATPAYSLLQKGTGDCKAFACVYAEICRQAGLECSMVTGIRDGQSWAWNRIILNNSTYYVDLIASNQAGSLRILTAAELEGYVWNEDG
jgi:hypothetical protein